jgi:hypothetical protein
LEQLFSSGAIVYVVLLLMVVEGIVLTLLNRTSAIGPSPKLVWSNLLAGAALVMALQTALLHQTWHLTAVWLAAALAAHVFDLYVKWRD